MFCTDRMTFTFVCFVFLNSTKPIFNLILSDIDEKKDLFIIFEWKRLHLMRHMPCYPCDFKSYNTLWNNALWQWDICQRTRDSDIKPINWIIRWLILPTVILRETWSTSAALWSPTPSLHYGNMYSVQYLSISVSKQYLYFYVYIAFCSCAQTQWGEVSVGLAAVGQS